jgi:hypothetical protein
MGAAAGRVELDPGADGRDPVDPLAARTIPARVCRHFQMIPVAFEGEDLALAIAEPGNALAVEVAGVLARRPVTPIAAPAEGIERAIDRIVGAAGGGARPAPEVEGEGRAAGNEAPVRIGAELDRVVEVERRLIAAEERIARIEATVERTAAEAARAAGFAERLRVAGEAEAAAAARIGDAERRLRGLIER